MLLVIITLVLGALLFALLMPAHDRLAWGRSVLLAAGIVRPSSRRGCLLWERRNGEIDEQSAVPAPSRAGAAWDETTPTPTV
jgi:hypothetical protein